MAFKMKGWSAFTKKDEDKYNKGRFDKQLNKFADFAVSGAIKTAGGPIGSIITDIAHKGKFRISKYKDKFKKLKSKLPWKKQDQ